MIWRKRERGVVSGFLVSKVGKREREISKESIQKFKV